MTTPLTHSRPIRLRLTYGDRYSSSKGAYWGACRRRTDSAYRRERYGGASGQHTPRPQAWSVVFSDKPSIEPPSDPGLVWANIQLEVEGYQPVR